MNGLWPCRWSITGGLECSPKNYGSPRMVDRVRMHVRSRSDVSFG